MTASLLDFEKGLRVVRHRLPLGEAEKGFEVFEPNSALGSDPEHPERSTSDEVVDKGPGHGEVVGHLIEGQQSLVHKRKRLRGPGEYFRDIGLRRLESGETS